MQSIAAEDDHLVEEMLALQHERQHEFLLNMCHPLDDYVDSGALDQSDSDAIRDSLFASLNDEVSRSVETSGVVVTDLDHFDELLLSILRDTDLWNQMEKERDRLMMEASASLATSSS